jgi:hypothetical protein
VAKLGFLKAYRASVSAGTKTTTLRRWKRPMLRAGQIVASPGIGRLEIALVRPIEWDALTEADARADGFDSLADLNRAIRRIYPQSDGDGRSWFQVRFRVLEKDAIAPPRRVQRPHRKRRRAPARSTPRLAPTSSTMSLGDKLKLARALRQLPMFGVA